jgi:hypothetical protein
MGEFKYTRLSDIVDSCLGKARQLSQLSVQQQSTSQVGPLISMCKLEILYNVIRIHQTILSNKVYSSSQIAQLIELWLSKIFFDFYFFNAISYMFLRNVLLYNMLSHVCMSIVIHFREWLGPNHSIILHAFRSD